VNEGVKYQEKEKRKEGIRRRGVRAD